MNFGTSQRRRGQHYLLMRVPAICLLLLMVSPTQSLKLLSRRNVLSLPFIAAAAAATTPAATALDIDSFVNSELSNDSTSPKMSEDEALCRFGFPSKPTGEACLRAGLSTKRTDTLDAFGKVDRGDYVKCKTVYLDGGDKYIKTTVCDGK
uniref:Uncharacterized protein n=1 Tax=Grammatophora oceanica TaxID=210454 RepID=A0A7S1VJA7_9STRA|mmetsp:Transcript_4643/g.6443  ORF Transcript_4643/g.6443 Transcript_4643/m.6443 type:complete len:150 (+) Transcript_4643:90-539(+)|eukprot:CAMPEP_0194029262 /NCGR_PEP_ID=MMETSP0009_2-20130614/3040_1 /TAXON_ID=210454 /ORGANISM="Grammatophora oceanica, Strain CCMP 410" /LENGTH=149 /DNA_ID=CAMNT_0038668877 /DNA_START=85 /DNA_END=534 /DNA_ORIENTATION=-